MSEEITYRSDMTVELIDSMGLESRIVEAAKVSVLGPGARDAEANTGLLKRLYNEHHSVPFEHVVFTFYIECPIMVSRQIVKHRISSINEESGRYRKFAPVFYVPGPERKLVQVGKTMEYNFEQGDPQQYEAVKFVYERMASGFWENYKVLLDMGISKEVARGTMPVSTYTSMFMTINLSSLLNFIQKRKEWEDGEVISHAQAEIAMVTEKMVDIIKESHPTVWQSFVDNGYVKV